MFDLAGVRSSLTEMATCNRCGATFTWKTNLRRHQKDRCKASWSPTITDTANAVVNNEIELAPTAVKKRKLNLPIIDDDSDNISIDDLPPPHHHHQTTSTSCQTRSIDWQTDSMSCFLNIGSLKNAMLTMNW